MILGIGIDIVHVPRIENAVERFGERFLERAFCPGEIEWCLKKRDPYPCLAGRFAAKEALVKALGTGFREGITLKQIGVERLDSGKPVLRLSDKAHSTARKMNVQGVQLSISHEREYAVAVVILEGGDEMSVEKVLFKSEEKKSAAEAAALLRTIADKVEEGNLQLRQGDSECSLAFPSSLVVEIKVEEKVKRNTKRSLEIELEWIEGEEGGEVQIA